MGRAERLKEVYEYVRTHYPIHTQADFAESLKYNRAYISSAMHGNEKNLTDKLFSNICEVYPDFDLNYLLSGTGNLLLSHYDASDRETLSAHDTFFRPAPPPDVPQWADSLISIIANQAKENEALVKELRSCLLEVRVLRDEIAALRTQSQ